MSVLFPTIAYTLFAAWALASAGAIGVWAWLTLSRNVFRRSVDTPLTRVAPTFPLASSRVRIC